MSSISWASATDYHDKPGQHAATEHGTYAFARGGSCNCVPCQRIVTVYQRRVRGGLKGAKRTLEVECWCGAKVVRATEDEIRAGLTRACSAPACVELDRAGRSRRDAA